MFLLALFAFLAGIVTILSPCILPVLPIVLSGSLTGGRKRPIGIVAGFILSFTFFTLALTTLVKATGLSADFLHNVAVVVIFLFGVSMIVPQTQVLLEALMSRLSGFTSKNTQRDGFLGGVLVGVSLGLIWAPCVGPILASVITLAITSQVSFAAVLITFAYALGSGIPMLAITYGGRQLLQKVPWLLRNTANIQKGFGVVMIGVAIAIFFNLDRKFQTLVLAAFPQYGAGLTAIEQNSAVSSELQKLRGTGAPVVATNLIDQHGPQAPDFVGTGTNWVNSPPLSLKKELRGKVVLVDFWTYSCINCIRTLPYVRKWYQTYKDQGFVVIGVHSPEFEFEKVTDNVKKAMTDLQVTYPVVQDNNLSIWNAFNNQYWPAHYLINKTGQIVYTHFGEGNYVETENAIRALLDQPATTAAEVSQSTQRLTPETYLGWGRADAYTNENPVQRSDMSAHFDFSQSLPEDTVGLKGDWSLNKEFITAIGDSSSLTLNFIGHQVYLVMGGTPKQAGQKVRVLLDGQPLPKQYWTKDMDASGLITIDAYRKFDILDLGQTYGRHTVEILLPNGVSAYAFTFG